MTGWVAPEEAKKIKNPIKATKASIQRGKEIYEKKCTLCHGDKGDGKGPASAGLNPKPTNFKGPHGHEDKSATGNTSGKSRQGEEGCLPSQKI